MSNLNELLIKFDLILSRNSNYSFSYNEIDILLNRVTENKNLQIECLNFFVKHNILQRNENNYYYLFEKCHAYQPYKNYSKLKNLIENEFCELLDISKIIL